MILVPLMFVVVLLGLRLFFGSILLTLATVTVVGLTNVAVLGLSAWSGIVLSPVSVSAPTIILTIAIADCVHIIVSYLAFRREGMDGSEAVVASLEINFKAVFITSLTTLVGFLGMNVSDSPPFRDLGNIVALGVAVAFALSVYFLPAVLAFLPIRGKISATSSSRAIANFADLVVKRPRTILVTAGIVLAGLMSLAFQNEVNDNFVEYFDDSTAFRQGADYAMQNLTGLNLIEYSLPSGEAQGIGRPEYLATLEAFTDWYRDQPKVLYVGSIVEVMKRLNQNVHFDDSAAYVLAQDRELAAQVLLFYEMLLPFGMDLNDQISLDKSTSRVTVLLDSITTNELLALEDTAQAWLRENAPPVMHIKGASPTIMFAHVGVENIRGMFKGAGVTLVLITLVLLGALRSIRLGALSVIVNVAPAAAAFGVWALLVGRIGVASSVVLSMALGLIVDDTVHFLTKYQWARQQGRDAEEAVRFVLTTVGPALCVTSLALIGGFLVLSLSAFVPNGDMGLLTAITIGLALVVDLLFLPALLLTIDGQAARREPTESSVKPLRPADNVA